MHARVPGLPGLLLLAACHGQREAPRAADTAGERQATAAGQDSAEARTEREVATVWPIPGEPPDPFQAEACPRHQWYEGPDPFPTACNPVGAHPPWAWTMQDIDHAMPDYISPEQTAIRAFRRYPSMGCTADPPLSGLDMVVPGYGGRVGVLCGPMHAASTGAELMFQGEAPGGSQQALDSLLRFSVEPGAERLDVSLPRPDLVWADGPDSRTEFFLYALLEEGADVSIRGAGGPADDRNPSNDGAQGYVFVRGYCGELDIDLDPWLGFDAAGSFPRFDVDVGWGVGNIELFPGTRLVGTSRLHVGGAGRLVIQSDTEARIDYPEGWTVVCYQVDNPACGTWGPGSLTTTPDAQPVIDLAGPRGVVVVLASPWPEDKACPYPNILTSGSGISPGPRLLNIAKGQIRPSCYERRTMGPVTLANSQEEAVPGVHDTTWLTEPEECKWDMKPGQFDPVDRGPWPGPPRWGGPRQALP